MIEFTGRNLGSSEQNPYKILRRMSMKSSDGMIQMHLRRLNTVDFSSKKAELEHKNAHECIHFVTLVNHECTYAYY
jgi:hypothetical protein